MTCHMTELMGLFEEDENLHDMSSVEDRRKIIREELNTWDNPDKFLITRELDP